MRRLVVCSTCKYSAESKFAPDGRTGGEMMLAEIEEALSRAGRSDVAVARHECLWNCTRPCSVLLQDDERFSYITGGNTPEPAQAEAIIAWFDLHGASADGVVPFRQWPQKMRGHFIARVPPVKP
ncbi:MAG: DUF1636 domain-containing protein [Alphaproteobacteria bacterium]|nr:DUF1636 domain-containing protein [Alphaproteobacteria bacterium]